MMRLKNEKPQAAEYVLAIACAVFFFALYSFSAAPGISLAGRSDLSLAVAVGSIPAVGGYPAYLILAKIFSLLPLGDFAHRTNLFSAFCGALSVLIVFFILRRYLTRNEGALFGAAALGFSSAVWARATVTRVETFDLMLLALAFYLALGWRTSGKPKYARLAALVMGVLIANDPVAAVIFLPLGLILWKPRIPLDMMLQMIALFGVGLAVYLYVPLLTLREQAAEWARMLSPQRAAAQAGGDFLMEGLKSGGEALERLRSKLLPSVSQFGWVFAFIGFLGFLRGLRRRVLVHAFLLAIFISLPIMLLVRRGEAVGLVPMFVFTIWVGVGMDWIFRVIVEFPRQRMAQTARAIATLLLGGILISVTVQSYAFYDRSDDRLVEHIVEGLLESPRQPALLISTEDEDKMVHAIWLAQVSKEIGPDVIAIDKNLLLIPWFREMLAREIPAVLNDTAGGEKSQDPLIRDIVELVNTSGERAVMVFVVPADREFFLTAVMRQGLYPLPRGFAIELKPDKPSGMIVEAERSADLMDELLSEVGGELEESQVLPAVRTYSASVANLGLFMEDAGLAEEAEARYHQAIEIDSTYVWPRVLLARFSASRGEVEAALKILREATRIESQDPVLLLELGRALVAADSLSAARTTLNASLDLDPNSACAWYTLGSIFLESDQLVDAERAFEKAKVLDPHSEFVHSCLSYIYLQLGRSDELAGEERRWLADNPHDFSSRLSLATALKLSGNLEEAQMELLRILEDSGDQAIKSRAEEELEEISSMMDSEPMQAE
jgi:tetratricopeptide (TPR) repeat protein